MLGEYLACGLPVITSSVAIKWVNPEIEESLVFCDEVSAISKEIDKVLQLRNQDKIRQYAINNLSVEIDEKNIEKDRFCLEAVI